MNILLTSVGRRVALLRAFQAELTALFPEGRVFAADASKRSAAFHIAHEGLLVPRCTDPGYVSALLGIVRTHKIKAIVPLIDTELLELARARARFADEGCQVVISDEHAVALSRDKAASVRHFESLGFKAPRVLEADALSHPDALEYPVFVKPADGSSSIGATRVDSPEELRYQLAHLDKPVVQSFESGEEFTIDVFADQAGVARCAVPRRRWETRAGEISKGITVKDPILIAQAKKLVTTLGGCRGCVTLQCFRKPDGQPTFFEANLRFGGGYPLSYAAGANYPRWTIEMCAGKTIADFDGWKDGLAMLRYDDAVFVERERL